MVDSRSLARAYTSPVRNSSITMLIAWVQCMYSIQATGKWSLSFPCQPVTLSFLASVMIDLVLVSVSVQFLSVLRHSESNLEKVLSLFLRLSHFCLFEPFWIPLMQPFVLSLFLAQYDICFAPFQNQPNEDPVIVFTSVSFLSISHHFQPYHTWILSLFFTSVPFLFI